MIRLHETSNRPRTGWPGSTRGGVAPL